MSKDPLDELAKRAETLPRAAPVEREPTLVGGFKGPTAPGTRHPLPPRQEPPGAPLGPPAPSFDSTLDSAAPPNVAREPRRKESPAYGTPASVYPALKRDAARRGVELVEVPESSAVPRRERPDSDPPRSVDSRDWWRTGKGVALAVPVIVAGVTGILGGITNVVVVPIIKAIREPYDGARAKDIAEAKAAGERCDAAVKSERETRQARQKDVDDRVLSVERRITELANRVPEVKPDPNRPPARN